MVSTEGVGRLAREDGSVLIKVKSDDSEFKSGLSRLGIEARVGLHCAPLAHKALGTYPTGTLRLSAGVFTTLDDFEALRMGIKEVLNETIL